VVTWTFVKRVTAVHESASVDELDARSRGVGPPHGSRAVNQTTEVIPVALRVCDGGGWWVVGWWVGGLVVGGGGCIVMVMIILTCTTKDAEDKSESYIGSGGGGGDHHNHSIYHWPDGHAHLHLCNTAGTM
jgi:hypothetical protein